MLSAQEAREKSEKSRKKYLKREWKKLRKKLKRATKKGKNYNFKVKDLSPEAKKSLKEKGFKITDIGNDYSLVDWEPTLSQK